MPLLPPKLVGPITPVAPSVRVEHTLPGAWVEIQVDGAPTGDVALCTSNSVTVPISGSLTPGGMVTATWSLGGETSPPSLPQAVLAYPAQLGAPVFLSPIHSAMDWVDLGVLYPGATVEVRTNAGVLIGGPDTAAGAAHRVHLTDTIEPGTQLRAHQTVDPPGVATVHSTPSESLPAESWFSREEQPPIPVVLGPIRECEGAVLVGGAVHGCWVRLTVSGRDFDFPAVAPAFWAVLPELATDTDTYAAANVLRQLGRESAASPAVAVDPSAALDKPLLGPDPQYCPRAVAVIASDLAPRSTLTFELRGASGSTGLFRAGAPDDRRSDTYYLGDLNASVPAAPPFPAVVLGEQLCAKAAESNRAGVHRRPEQEVPPGFFSAPQECATGLHVVNASGCVVTVHSDAGDWPVLASWTLVPLNGWIGLNRPLRRGEDVQVRIEAGCVPADLLTSDWVTVEAADVDRMRIVEPVRPGRSRSVFLEDAVPGGRVHVYVDNHWRASANALPVPGQAWTEVYVGELTEESSVTAVQTLCGRTSNPTPAVNVQLGRLDLHATVGALVRGVATALTVRAFDADTGGELAGLRVRGPAGDVGWVGQPFTLTASGAPTTIRLTVAAEGYATGILDLPVTAPTPPPSKTLTVRSQVALGAHVAVQKITAITWTLTGAGAPPAQSQSPQATSCQFVFSIPSPSGGSAVWYRLAGSATIEFIDPASGGTLTRSVTSFYTAFGLRNWLDVEWRGISGWREINIAWAPIHDPQTGAQIDTVFCFVLAADG